MPGSSPAEQMEYNWREETEELEEDLLPRWADSVGVYSERGDTAGYRVRFPGGHVPEPALEILRSLGYRTKRLSYSESREQATLIVEKDPFRAYC